MSSKLSGYKPEFSDVIRSIIDTVLLDLNVSLPAKVVKYDSATQYADVQIQLLQGFQDGTTDEYAVIPNVPVKHPRANAGAAFIHVPLTIGDDVVLVFSQRSLDNWKSSGGLVDPQDPRKHHITDAYALIGGSAIPDAFTPKNPTAIEIVNGALDFSLFPNGSFSATNPTGEFVDILDQIAVQTGDIANTLSTDTTNTLLGPQPLLHAATYAEIYEELQSLKTMLDSFKV